MAILLITLVQLRAGRWKEACKSATCPTQGFKTWLITRYRFCFYWYIANPSSVASVPEHEVLFQNVLLFQKGLVSRSTGPPHTHTCVHAQTHK